MSYPGAAQPQPQYGAPQPQATPQYGAPQPQYGAPQQYTAPPPQNPGAPPAYQNNAGAPPQQQQMNANHQNQADGVGALCCCFDAGPVEGDPYANGRAMFKTTMCNAPCADPLCFCAAFTPCTLGCTQFGLRKKVLKGDMSRYICCQGVYGSCCCFKPGEMGEKDCPDCCLCIESCCFPGAAASASRIVVMQERGLMSDPCDRRIIRFNNCLQAMRCFCDILACFFPAFEDAARIIRQISQIVFCTTVGCMTAQVNHELESGDGPAHQQMK